MRLAAPLLLLLMLAACGEAPHVPAAPGPAEDEALGAGAFEVFFAGVLTDTLRGEARFGVVMDARTQARRFVVVMRPTGLLAGGLFLARTREALPAEGRYAITAYADSLALPAEDFVLVYRDGMRRAMDSAEGTVTFTVVRDTLLAGEFTATLEGAVMRPSGPPAEGAATVQGAFRAARGDVGFILGLR